MTARCTTLLFLLAAAGCAHPGATPPDDVAAAPSGAELALRCARETAQANGFHVRLTDPREPYLLLADLGGTSPRNDRLVVRVQPSSNPEEPARVMANAEGPGRSQPSNEATETARRIETRCGRTDGAR